MTQSYPGNYQAYRTGRISKHQYDSMAVHKFLSYGNDEDLDVERSYDGIEKLYPVLTLRTKNGRDIISPDGFAAHVLGQEVDDDVRDAADGDTMTFVYRGAGWTWVAEGATDPKGEVIYYTFGEALGCKPDSVAQYVTGVEDCYD